MIVVGYTYFKPEYLSAVVPTVVPITVTNQKSAGRIAAGKRTSEINKLRRLAEAQKKEAVEINNKVERNILAGDEWLVYSSVASYAVVFVGGIGLAALVFYKMNKKDSPEEVVEDTQPVKTNNDDDDLFKL